MNSAHQFKIIIAHNAKAGYICIIRLAVLLAQVIIFKILLPEIAFLVMLTAILVLLSMVQQLSNL